MNERNLIELCLADNRNAQHELYERYKRAMYTLAYRMTGDFETAGEILQDAFLQVFRHLPDFQGKSTLGAWIKTIVVRTALSELRRRRIVFEPLEPHRETGPVDWGTSIDAEYLERAIQSLPEGYRAVFVLAEVEGYAHKEIGDLLGISEGTSKSQLFYAKKRLREMLTVV